MNLVTIKTFFYDHQTILYEPKFKSEGIEYFLKDQKTVAIDPLVSNAIGGIKLQVRQEDEVRARALVAEIEANNSSSNLGDIITVNGQRFEKTLDECPKCESEEVYFYKQSFLEGLFRPFQKLDRYCQSCTNRW
jgi:DNA-directed RNA polymerase subunit M/transcription elongation factor TFIIS